MTIADCLEEIRQLRELNSEVVQDEAKWRSKFFEAREENERLKAEIVETLAKIESRWKEDEKKYERARELLSLCIEDGVGYLQLQNDIRAFLDNE